MCIRDSPEGGGSTRVRRPPRDTHPTMRFVAGIARKVQLEDDCMECMNQLTNLRVLDCHVLSRGTCTIVHVVTETEVDVWMIGTTARARRISSGQIPSRIGPMQRSPDACAVST
eukprot:6899453-Prymnesium_polylepis.1